MDLLHDNKVLLLDRNEQGSPDFYPLPEMMTVGRALNTAFAHLEAIQQAHEQAMNEIIPSDIAEGRFATSEEAREHYRTCLDLPVYRRVLVMSEIVELCAPFVDKVISREVLGDA